MHDKIRAHVEGLFEQAPRNRRTAELKDELISNLCDRYNDLVARGQDEFAAFSTVIDGIGDFDELITGLQEAEQQEPEVVQMEKQKSALLVSSAVAIYILSGIFMIIGRNFGRFGETVGAVFCLISVAAATMLLVYHFMTKPKAEKNGDTIVENFKAWSANKEEKKSTLKLLSSLIWSAAVMVYLFIGVFFDAFETGWLIFPLAIVVNNIVALLFKTVGGGK